MSKRIYLDWNATAPLLPEARSAMLSALEAPCNASSVHAEGRASRMLIETARRSVAALVGGQTANVVFTSGASEAANMVLTPSWRMGRSPLVASRLYVSAIEHPAVRQGGRFAADRVHQIPVTPAGVVDLEALDATLEQHDRGEGLPLVAIMLANNETGIIQPVADAAAIVHRHSGLLVVDAVQAVGRLPVDMESLGADFLFLSGHKLGGPAGAGALVARGEVLMPEPLLRGGGQEKGHRAGTENVGAIAGLGAAAAFALEDLDGRNVAIAGLRDRLEREMRRLAPDLVIHGSDSQRIANTTFFSLPGLKGETGQIAFDLEGVAISAGSACSSGKVGKSQVLVAMGHDAATGGLRISLGSTTGEEDIDRAIEVFGRIAARRKQAEKAA